MFVTDILYLSLLSILIYPVLELNDDFVNPVKKMIRKLNYCKFNRTYFCQNKFRWKLFLSFISFSFDSFVFTYSISLMPLDVKLQTEISIRADQ